MLSIIIPETEYFNRCDNTFTTIEEQVLELEHSLVSISKWESEWEKPFLIKEDKTYKETIDYIRCMTITKNVNPLVYTGITAENIAQVTKYMELSRTATTFRKEMNPHYNRDIITSEVIYYKMISLGIPLECESWYLNRLLTLIRVCDIKNAPLKKMGLSDIYRNNTALNAARRKNLGSKG